MSQKAQSPMAVLLWTVGGVMMALGVVCVLGYLSNGDGGVNVLWLAVAALGLILAALGSIIHQQDAK
jgi:hypothetical protein